MTPEIELLAHQINHSFNAKPGKGVGHFVSEVTRETKIENEEGETTTEKSTENVAEFAEGLKQYLEVQKEAGDNVEDAFHAFSVSATQRLVRTLAETGTVETGFLIFASTNT